MRALQTLASGSLGSAASVTIPFTALRTKIGGLLANVEAIFIRLTKTVATVNRPQAAAIRLRDSAEVLFDSNGIELLAQSRERGEGIVAQLGAASAADTCILKWRPGYGQEDGDLQQAAGLFQGGDITITTQTDAGQTTNYEVVVAYALSKELKLPTRRVTRQLGASAREQAGQFLIAGVRDLSFSAAANYSLSSGQREIFSGVNGASLQNLYEGSLGPAGDPVVLTAVASSTLQTPNLIRAACAGQSTNELPPLSKLPSSEGNIQMVAGFVGTPLTSVLYPRSEQEIRDRLAEAAARAGIPVPTTVKVKTRNGNSFRAAELAPYMPITAKAM